MVLQATETNLRRLPAGGLLYYPAVPESEEPPAATFVAGETLEFQRNDPARAAEFFRGLARSPDPGYARAPCCGWAGTFARPAATRKPSKPTTSSPGSADPRPGAAGGTGGA